MNYFLKRAYEAGVELAVKEAGFRSWVGDNPNLVAALLGGGSGAGLMGYASYKKDSDTPYPAGTTIGAGLGGAATALALGRWAKRMPDSDMFELVGLPVLGGGILGGALTGAVTEKAMRE